jgi:hypothetical protein
MADSQPSPSPLPFPGWQTQYQAALMETNGDKLPKVVAAAERAILSRLQVLAGKVGHEQERIAMTDALHALRYLKGSIALQ